MKSDIIYSNETLYVILEGVMKRKDKKVLKERLNNIINEYGINDIVFDTKKLINSDELDFTEYNNVTIRKM